MCTKILVAYATRFGTTKEVANAIGQALRDSGNIVAVRPISDVEDVTPYQAVVVGSATKQNHWLPETVDFLKQHRQELRQLPVAYFSVCATLHDDDRERREQLLHNTELVRQAVPEINPVAIGIFAGELIYSNLPWPERIMTRVLVQAPEGDFRNWNAIRSWARKLRLILATA